MCNVPQAPTTTQTPPSNPNQYFLPSATPDPRLPVAGNSAFVGEQLNA